MYIWDLNQAWLIVKQVDGTNAWFYQDTTRNPDNPMGASGLRADTTAENTNAKGCDFLSNGFKWRVTTGYGNDTDQKISLYGICTITFCT